MAVDITDELIKLERSAEEARAKLAGLEGEEYAAQWRAWADAAEAFQATVTAHAKETGQPRHEVETAAKKAVRHAEEDPAE
ncbi:MULTISPECIES: hypothetical protein [Streptomyces]